MLAALINALSPMRMLSLAVFVVVLGWGWWMDHQLQTCRAEKVELQRQWTAAREKAAHDTLTAVRALTQAYEEKLRERNARIEAVNAEYAQAMRQITEGREKDAEYRRWADQPLPAAVVKRLQHLQAER